MIDMGGDRALNERSSSLATANMQTQPPLFEDFVESDPPTLNGLGVGEVDFAKAGEWALIRYVGNPIGEVLPLGPAGLSLGRAPENQIRLPEPEVSRHHARLEVVPQKGLAPIVLLSDLGSTNGTYVNGAPGSIPATARSPCATAT